MSDDVKWPESQHKTQPASEPVPAAPDEADVVPASPLDEVETDGAATNDGHAPEPTKKHAGHTHGGSKKK